MNLYDLPVLWYQVKQKQFIRRVFSWQNVRVCEVLRSSLSSRVTSQSRWSCLILCDASVSWGAHLPSLGRRKTGASNSAGTLVLIRAFFRYSKPEVAETLQLCHARTEVGGIRVPCFEHRSSLSCYVYEFDLFRTTFYLDLLDNINTQGIVFLFYDVRFKRCPFTVTSTLS